jgi:hypothetical protein
MDVVHVLPEEAAEMIRNHFCTSLVVTLADKLLVLKLH